LGPSAQERSDEESNKIEQAARRITKLFNEEMEKLTGPWFDSYGQKDNIRNQVVSTFKTAMKTLRSAKPDHVCRKCNGDGCNKCGKSGLVTTDTHQNNLDLTADPKSKS
jgi:DNA phosphorothioation-dependent restriction protein DptG